MPEIRKIIIDTDPGQDDAVAILLAFASPELEVLGITAVAGNVPLALTEKNARKICELAGHPEVKVFAGAVRPMVRTLVTAENVHGKTGLNGPDLPEPRMPLQKAACRRLHHRDADAGGKRLGHALPARTADQHRAGAGARA